MVVVTHRQYLIPMADQIIIMGQGTVVISGTAAEVLQKLSADSSKGASSDKLEAV